MLLRELIIDASGIINLLSGAIADVCLGHVNPASEVTPAIERECNVKGDTALAFRNLLDAGLLERCEEEISADDLATFMETYDLGAGESEAILVCGLGGRSLWCDDRKARNAAADKLGPARVTGTLGILLELVRLEELMPDVANISYSAMIAAGGRLPRKTLDDFNSARA